MPVFDFDSAIKIYFGDSALSPGGIVGEIGKISVVGTVPPLWFNASFMVCKMHNYAADAKKAEMSE